MIQKYGLFIFFLLIVSNIMAQPAGLDPSDSTLIPAEKLAPYTWAIASQSVVNVRRSPAYAAEMVTQVLLGTPVKILAKKRNWYQIQTPEGYEGWTSGISKRIDSVTLHKINRQPRVIVMDNDAFVYASPDSKEIVLEVVMGNILQLENTAKQKGNYKIILPDGRSGFIKISSVKKWDEWKRSIQLTGNSIEQTAKHFIGLPYVWAGTSSRGLDCSGLTKMTYFMHGIILPRDARQQYLTGTAMDSLHHFEKVQKGDLLFFGKKYPDDSTRYNVVHTAIYLQNEQFIHAGDGCIQISSLNPSDSNFDAHNLARYVTAKRILNEPTNGVWSIFTHPWYQ
jgi:SH3-like domain-containing protein